MTANPTTDIPSWAAIESLTAGVVGHDYYHRAVSQAWTLTRAAAERVGFDAAPVAEAAKWARELEESVPSRNGDMMFPQYALGEIRSALGIGDVRVTRYGLMTDAQIARVRAGGRPEDAT